MKRIEKGRNLRIQISDYTVIDLETTGRDISECEVIEFAAVRVRNGIVTDAFSELVHPLQPIPFEITLLTGITDSDVASADNCKNVLRRFLAFIGSDIVVGHNILTYDSNIIYDLSVRYFKVPFRNDMIDTFQYARFCKINPTNYKLSTLAEYFGISHEHAHRALEDCMANFRCFEAMKPLLQEAASATTSGGAYERKTHYKQKPSQATQALNKLRTIIHSVLEDGILTDNEIYDIQNWMKENLLLEGAYPYDVIFQKLESILEDGIITEDERVDLMSILKEQSDPVAYRAESCTIDFNGKYICLTGEFFSGPRVEMEQQFAAAGAIIEKNVTKKTNALIVGGAGSEAWSCGNYGNKVKKALELQEKGHPIIIIKEEEAVNCLSQNSTPKNNSPADTPSNMMDTSLSAYDQIIKLIQELAHKAAINHDLPDSAFDFVTNQKSFSLWFKEPMTNARSQMILTVEPRGRINQKFGRIIAKKTAVDRCSLTLFAPLPNNPTSCYYDAEPFSYACCDDIIWALLNDFVDNFTPAERFGCCDLYRECSAAKKCLHRDLFYSKACWYRKNLESGKIFY